MKRTIAIMTCLLALALVAESKSTKQSLANIQNGWMNKSITVRNGVDLPNVMQLLKAFHAEWPTSSVEALIAEAGDRRFVTNDVTECDDCSGHVFVDCDDFHCASYDDGEIVSQRMEARAFYCENGHTIFAVCFEEGSTTQMPVCCYYDYDPATKTMTPVQPPYSSIHRKWPDSHIHCFMGFGYDQTIIVQECIPEDEYWNHLYVFDGMNHIYNHSGYDFYDNECYKDEEDEYIELPEEAVMKDETDEMELYLGPANDSVESNEISMWLVDKNTGYITRVMTSNNNVAPRWEQLSKERGILVPIDEIAIGDCYNCFFIPWNHNYIFIEGCPDGRNIWSYVIDLENQVGIQFPSNSGIYKIEPESGLLYMSSYGYYPEGGRYTIVRTYVMTASFAGWERKLEE